MTDRSSTILPIAASAAVGAAIGYLLFTEGGRRLRRRLDAALDEVVRDVNHVRIAVRQVADVTSETWKLMNETIRDLAASPPPSAGQRQTRPF